MSGFNIYGFEVNTRYTETLSEYVEKLRYEDIPAEVRERVKFAISHTIGAALAAAPMQLAKSADKVGKEISPSGAATSWISGEKMSPIAASFVNGTIADMLDWEDCAYTGHPCPSLVATLIALGEEKKLSGKKIIEAFIAGYETYARIGLSSFGYPENRRKPIKYGTALSNISIFASSLAAAKIFDLDAERVNQTIGMSVLYHKQISNLAQATMSEAYHYEYGFCAQGGLQAAVCAREGLNGLRDALDIPHAYSQHIVDEPTMYWLDKELGKRYLIMEMLIKRWPANMWLQSPIETALALLEEHQFDLEEIKEIIIDPPQDSRMHFRPEGYASLMDAEFSAPYSVSVALHNPVADASWYMEPNMTDPKVLALAAKVHGGPSEPAKLPQNFAYFVRSNGTAFPPVTVTIVMNDGTVYEKTCMVPKGHPANMMTKDEFHEIFMHQASAAISAEKAEALFDFIMHLEEQEDLSVIGQFFEK